jgi:hypothetical protein
MAHFVERAGGFVDATVRDRGAGGVEPPIDAAAFCAQLEFRVADLSGGCRLNRGRAQRQIDERIGRDRLVGRIGHHRLEETIGRGGLHGRIGCGQARGHANARNGA